MILKIFKKITDFLQDWFGLDGLLLARIFSILVVIINTIEIIVLPQIGMDIISIFISCVLPSILFLYGIKIINLLRKKFKEDPGYDTTEFIRNFNLLRLISFGFFIFSVWDIYEIVGTMPSNSDTKLYYKAVYNIVGHIKGINIFLIVYFASCPPKNLNNPSKFRKLLTRLKTAKT